MSLILKRQNLLEDGKTIFMSKILVVGGNGYIGSHMRRDCPDFLYIGREEFDLRNKEEILHYCKPLDISMCIILSSSISYEKQVNFNDEPFSTNLIGLNNLLDVLQESHPHVHIVYFSSMTVYSDNNASPVLESSDLNPLHTYGLSKVYAESLIKYYDFHSVIIRIPGIYGGSRKSGLIYNSIQKLKNNEEIIIDTSNLGYWETMHIDDMLDMFNTLLKTYTFTSKFEVFNISYGEKTDIIDMLHFMSDALHSKSKIYVEKKYKDLYLSNKKISSYTKKQTSFYDKLLDYIKEL